MLAIAWLSLGSQLMVLIGSRGLLPLATVSDGVLRAGIWAGVLLAVLALVGVAPRLMFALSIPLYLSYATAARSFLAFQWDNLLLESLLLAAILPADRRAPIAHLLLRVLLFKLYFESGIAKYRSHLGDWIDGSAMSYYYETAPIPSPLAWFAHHLPGWWHSLESRATLVLELLLPIGIFARRPIRLVVFAALTGFQIVNLATANYGFFVYLALALHVFLLDDRDLGRLRARFRLWRRRLSRPRLRVPARVVHALTLAFAIGYVAISLSQALVRFTLPFRDSAPLVELANLLGPLRVVNTYHLFGHITRERIEPTFESFDGQSWREHDFVYKPGDPKRAPPFVAPHQPRVDFLLWFHGLNHRALPDWVRALLDRMCHDPGAVEQLFAQPLPDAPAAVRIRYHRYQFTSAEERARSGAWWTRTLVSATPAFGCRR